DARVAPQHVVDAARALEQPRELREQLADRVRLVGPEVGARALDARAVARPGLGLRIARLDEERERRPAVVAQDERGVRVVEARQVVEVAVLTEAVVGVARARRQPRSEQDRDRAGLHRLQEPPAAGGEQGGLVRLRALLAMSREHGRRAYRARRAARRPAPADGTPCGTAAFRGTGALRRKRHLHAGLRIILRVGRACVDGWVPLPLAARTTRDRAEPGGNPSDSAHLRPRQRRGRPLAWNLLSGPVVETFWMPSRSGNGRARSS